MIGVDGPARSCGAVVTDGRPSRTDASRHGKECSRIVNGGKPSLVHQETVARAVCVLVIAHDISFGVDPKRTAVRGAREIDCREGALDGLLRKQWFRQQKESYSCAERTQYPVESSPSACRHNVSVLKSRDERHSICIA